MVSDFALFFRLNQLQAKFVELRLVDIARCVEHHVAAVVVFREGDVVADRLRTAEERAEPVETEGQSAVRGAPYLKAFIRKPKRSCACSAVKPSNSNILACSFESWIRIEPPPISVPLQTKS